MKSELHRATRPSAFPAVPRECLYHHNLGCFGASLPPPWALSLKRPLDCKPHTCCITNRSQTVPVSKTICKNPLSSNSCHLKFPLFSYDLLLTHYFYTGLFPQYPACVTEREKDAADLTCLHWLCYCDCSSKSGEKRCCSRQLCNCDFLWNRRNSSALLFLCGFFFLFFFNLKSQMLPLDWVQTSHVIKK